MKAFMHTLIILLTLCTTLHSQTYYTRQAPIPCLDKKFSIVAHIVRDSLGRTNYNAADIVTIVDNANAFFKPACISFEVCETNIIDNFQYDILGDTIRFNEMLAKYHQPWRINLFLVTASFIIPNPEECGYATQDGIQQPLTGGIVLVKSCASALTLAHEIGHYFGLLHTFEGSGSEQVNRTNCENEGDLLCDTPADPFIPGSNMDEYIDINNACRFISQRTDVNGEFYTPDVGNIMSYYPADCQCGFTYEQFLRMIKTCQDAPAGIW